MSTGQHNSPRPMAVLVVLASINILSLANLILRIRIKEVSIGIFYILCNFTDLLCFSVTNKIVPGRLLVNPKRASQCLRFRKVQQVLQCHNHEFVCLKLG